MKPGLLLPVLSICIHVTGLAQPTAPPAAPTETAPSPDWANNALKAAIDNMAQLTSYHISAEIQAGPKPTLEGDLGPGTLSFHGDDKKGNKRQRRVVEGKFYISNDNGKTWEDDPDKQSTIGLSNMVTGPVSPVTKVWEKGTFTPKEVKVNGEDLLLLEKPAKDKEPAAQYWLVKDEKLKAILVRKVSITIAADDAEFPIIVTYTKFNEPVEIKAPK